MSASFPSTRARQEASPSPVTAAPAPKESGKQNQRSDLCHLLTWQNTWNHQSL